MAESIRDQLIAARIEAYDAHTQQIIQTLNDLNTKYSTGQDFLVVKLIQERRDVYEELSKRIDQFAVLEN